MSLTKQYSIAEIFASLQGEGFHTGVPAVFIRMAGCNRQCAYCDTDHRPKMRLTASEIVKRATAFAPRLAILTGGEPLLQLDAPLIEALHTAGFRIAIETNGSLPVPKDVDWVTCSPKDPPLNINRIDELKIIWHQDIDPDVIAARLPECHHRFIQPCSCQNVDQIIDYLLTNPHWRLSLQTHKYINIQ